MVEEVMGGVGAEHVEEVVGGERRPLILAHMRLAMNFFRKQIVIFRIMFDRFILNIASRESHGSLKMWRS